MKKSIYLSCFLIPLLWSCATYQPPPPSFFIDSLPQSIIAELTLEERIIAEEAWNSLKQGEGNKARKIIAKLDSQSPFYYTGLGYVYYLDNDLKTAVDYFKAAVQDHPDLALAHLGLSQIYQETGQDDLAFSEFREVLKREPEHAWARSKYENIRKIKTDEALFDAKTLRAEGSEESSKTAYLKALYYSPGATEAHLALSEIYTESNEYQEALVHLKAAHDNEPQNKSILQVYGEVLFLSEDNKNCLEVYERLTDLEPENQAIKERIEILKNRLGIFELPSQYDSIPFSDAITKEEMSALIGVKFKNYFTEPSRKPPIIIDISTSWASKYILSAATLNIMDVYSNHTFQPKKFITRAEMAEALIRLIDQLKKKGYRFLQQIPPERIHIADVSSDNFYYRPIVTMISYDIMSLSLGRKFNPDQAISGSVTIRLLDIIIALTK